LLHLFSASSKEVNPLSIPKIEVIPISYRFSDPSSTLPAKAIVFTLVFLLLTQPPWEFFQI
jgi:hypothetical protein